MPHHQPIRITGTVTDVFAHRFVVQTDAGRVLADLTPHGADIVSIQSGDEVTIDGEQRPSEIKVGVLERNGRRFEVEQADAHHPPHAPIPNLGPIEAKALAKEAGYRVSGEPRRKPRHFELLGERNGQPFELHVHEDGLRHEKPVDGADPKWRSELRQMADEAGKDPGTKIPPLPHQESDPDPAPEEGATAVDREIGKQDIRVDDN